MTEIILGPIIGGLSHNRVKLWARADRSATLYAWIATRKNLSDRKIAGKTQLRAAHGFAGIVTLDGLTPGREYFFALSLDPKPAPPKSAFSSFRTFPPPGKAVSFRFAFGSCFLPVRTEPGLTFQHIEENHRDIAFLLMLGDQIYADEASKNGLGHIATNLADYRSVYQTTWSNPHHRALLAQMPVFMTLDDHEMDNDWHWDDRALKQPDYAGVTRFLRKLQGLAKEEQGLTLQRANAALQANWEHQVMHAPGNLSPRGPLAYEIEYGATAFFIMDTRTQRFMNEAERQLLGEKQWKMLAEWLLRVKDSHPVKFIASSISILSNILGDWTDDRWSGFQEERERLFAFIARHGIKGVHILAGDLHSAHEITALLRSTGGEDIPVREFCSSPFEQKPNRLARWIDWPAKSNVLHSKKRVFVISRINYGVVRVDLANKAAPKVHFELNYEKWGNWFVKSTTT